MTVSKSNPVEFWINGSESYNTKTINGVYSQCFNQIFDCNTPVSVAVKPKKPLETALMYDFTTGLQGISSFPGSNRSGATQFVWDFNTNAVADAGSDLGPELTQYFAIPPPSGLTVWPVANYTISIRAKNNSYGISDPIGVGIWSMPDALSQTFNSSTTGTSSYPNDNTYYDRLLSFELTSPIEYVAIDFSRNGGGGNFGINVSIDYIEINSENAIFSYDLVVKDRAGSPIGLPVTFTSIATFLPSDYASCGDYISLEIQEQGTSNLYFSDLIELKDPTSDPGILTISYFNNSTFDDIQHNGTVFSLYLHAQFWKETSAEEFEDIEESQNTFVRTYNELAEKTLLETDFIPNYMHQKLRRVLMHDNIVINGKNWIKKDEYEQENLNRYALSRANVWLTDKDSILRNVI